MIEEIKVLSFNNTGYNGFMTVQATYKGVTAEFYLDDSVVDGRELFGLTDLEGVLDAYDEEYQDLGYVDEDGDLTEAGEEYAKKLHIDMVEEFLTESGGTIIEYLTKQMKYKYVSAKINELKPEVFGTEEHVQNTWGFLS